MLTKYKLPFECPNLMKTDVSKTCSLVRCNVQSGDRSTPPVWILFCTCSDVYWTFKRETCFTWFLPGNMIYSRMSLARTSLCRTYPYVEVFSRSRSHCSLFQYNSTSIRRYLYLEIYPYVE